MDWLLLTKRPQNIEKMLPADWRAGYSNVWLGTTAEDQERFDQRWPHLVAIPAVVRFVSYEPAVGPLRLPACGPWPDWLICGGESGGRARSMQAQWARDIIADCRARRVAPFLKQWGTYRSNPLVSEAGIDELGARVIDPHGKGGGMIDGRLIRDFPKTGTAMKPEKSVA
ncbi:protein gp37 [Rhodoplanes tepidamans]|nr:protein gp37 [Rhodoplanes tepidamans]